MMRARLTEERGSTIPLLMFFCVLGLTVIAVVVAATSLYIERKRLYTLADGASLAATENFALSSISRAGDRLQVHLSDAQVWDAASRYLRDADAPGVRLVGAGSPDAQSARVTVSADWAPPVLNELLPWRLTLQVTSTARTVFR